VQRNAKIPVAIIATQRANELEFSIGSAWRNPKHNEGHTGMVKSS
jgi:hypothetical protein